MNWEIKNELVGRVKLDWLETLISTDQASIWSLHIIFLLDLVWSHDGVSSFNCSEQLFRFPGQFRNFWCSPLMNPFSVLCNLYSYNLLGSVWQIKLLSDIEEDGGEGFIDGTNLGWQVWCKGHLGPIHWHRPIKIQSTPCHEGNLQEWWWYFVCLTFQQADIFTYCIQYFLYDVRASICLTRWSFLWNVNRPETFFMKMTSIQMFSCSLASKS